MALIKVKDAGQTPDNFKTVITNGNPIPEGTVAGNIIIADENAQTKDSGVSVDSLATKEYVENACSSAKDEETATLVQGIIDGTQAVGNSDKLGGISADSYATQVYADSVTNALTPDNFPSSVTDGDIVAMTSDVNNIINGTTKLTMAVDTDYTTSRGRNILLQTATPTSIPNGSIVAVYS